MPLRVGFERPRTVGFSIFFARSPSCAFLIYAIAQQAVGTARCHCQASVPLPGRLK